MLGVISFAIKKVIIIVSIVTIMIGTLIGWILTRNYYNGKIVAEKNNYIVTLENENKRQNNEIKVYKTEIEEKNTTIDWMEKSIDIYMSVYGCF